MIRARTLRRLGIAGLCVACVTAIVVRAVVTARAELDTAVTRERSGDTVQAIEHYRRAMRWSVPLSPFSDRAEVALRELAVELEAEGRIEEALLAWRSLVGSAAATRTLYARRSSSADDEAKDAIARLVAKHQRAGIDVGADPEELAGAHRALLDAEIGPHPGWSTLLLLGFAIWIGGVTMMATRGFDRAGRLRWAGMRLPVAGALAGLIVSLLGMLFA